MNTFRFNRIVAILLISAGAIGAADRKIVIVNADRYPWAVNSYFIAVSRGGLYDTPSLVKALDSRKLAGAGLDVTGPEPLPGQSPGSLNAASE
jgi:D-isomer specific 2-hydroxyacid dehydrogenase, NAD binding domain